MSKRIKTDAEPVELVDIEFTLAGGETWKPTRELVTTMQAAYVGVDVLGEMWKAKAWCVANVAKRKTARGMPRFLNSWMSRQHDTVRQQRQANGAGSRFAPILPTFDDEKDDVQ